jgi:hypothetical protein
MATPANEADAPPARQAALLRDTLRLSPRLQVTAPASTRPPPAHRLTPRPPLRGLGHSTPAALLAARGAAGAASRSAARPIRLHDLRATCLHHSLANGRGEAWAQDRTGHKASILINRSRRVTRSVAELGLGELRSLDEAIPEFATEGVNKSDGDEGPARKTYIRTSTSAPWRNGRRRGFKILRPRGRSGSSPDGATRRNCWGK